MDYQVPKGTPLYAADSGIVIHAEMTGKAGITIVIRSAHLDVQSYYMHLDSIKVTRGQIVSAGTHIGWTGNTGNVGSSNGGDGAHLHLQQTTVGTPYVNGIPPRDRTIHPCVWEN